MLVSRLSFNGRLLASFLVSIFLLVSLQRCESQTPPRDNKNCRLNASSPFSYVVQVWDAWRKQQKDNGLPDAVSAAHFHFGALMTVKAVLSTGWYFRKALTEYDWVASGKYTRFTVIGQNVWDYHSARGREYPCYQIRKVANIHLHPKAKEAGTRLHYDFSVIELDIFFDIMSPNFPTMFFPTEALDLLLYIRYVNSLGASALCTLPIPKYESITGDNYWVFAERIDVSSIPFHSVCTSFICRQTVINRHTSSGYRNCVNNFMNKNNGTMLCMAPRWSPTIRADVPPVPSSYAGVPLVCNGSTLGLSSQVKIRFGYFPGKYDQDFFFVVTLLRIFRWMVDKIQEQSPTFKPNKVEEKDFTFVRFPPPARRPTPDWGLSDFYKLPVDNVFPIERELPKEQSPAVMNCLPCFWKTLVVPLVTHATFHIQY